MRYGKVVKVPCILNAFCGEAVSLSSVDMGNGPYIK